MQIIAGVSKISKTVPRDLTFISNVQNLAFIVLSFQSFLLERMLSISHKMASCGNVQGRLQLQPSE